MISTPKTNVVKEKTPKSTHAGLKEGRVIREWNERQREIERQIEAKDYARFWEY